MNRADHIQIVAEAGVNHSGSLELALLLIDAAAEAGADIVKFQTFKAAHVASRFAEKAAYQALTTSPAENQLDMIRSLELSESDHDALVARANERNIGFLSTPFDLPSLRLLVGKFRRQTIKLPSGEITNAPFLLACARERPRIILSTGMSTLGEVETALGVLAFGYVAGSDVPASREAFSAAYASNEGQQALRANVTLLHCTSEYPAPVDTVNLRALDTLRNAFGLPVGFSDHTSGINVAVAAAARGACIIEKHFTLDRDMPGPDHAASMTPDDLAAMVNAIREVESALGDGIKRPADVELKNRLVVRRSLVATQVIKRGEVFTVENLTAKRPGGGISPSLYWDILGRRAERDYLPDDPIEP
jgi:N-acetylneuraminate synthase